jgi:guanine deaminase
MIVMETVERDRFMKRALELAAENAKSGRGGPFGSVIVRGDHIIAEGTNLVTSANDPTAHAEIVAIRQACGVLGTFHLTECELYTSCEPCPMCLAAIYWARPAAIYYCGTQLEAASAGFDDSLIYRELCLPANERLIPMQRLLPDQANGPFDVWRRNANRVPY